MPELKTKIHHCEITDKIRDVFTIEKQEFHILKHTIFQKI